MWANNEVGTVQPVAQVAALGREHGIQCTPTPSPRQGTSPSTSATAGWRRCPSPVTSSAVRGIIGALVLGRDTPVYGPAARRWARARFRSGTQNVAGAIGMAAGLAVATANLELEAATVGAMRDRLFDHLLTVRGTRVNGPARRVAPARQRACVICGMRGRFAAHAARCAGESSVRPVRPVAPASRRPAVSYGPWGCRRTPPGDRCGSAWRT